MSKFISELIDFHYKSIDIIYNDLYIQIFNHNLKLLTKIIHIPIFYIEKAQLHFYNFSIDELYILEKFINFVNSDNIKKNIDAMITYNTPYNIYLDSIINIDNYSEFVENTIKLWCQYKSHHSSFKLSLNSYNSFNDDYTKLNTIFKISLKNIN
jgi:hypothetical protein